MFQQKYKKNEFSTEIEFHRQSKKKIGSIWAVVLFYRIDLIGETTNSAGRRFFRTGLEIAFSTLCSAYCEILTFADGVGDILVFIINAITVASLSFSSHYDRRLRQASLATTGDRKKVICRPDPSWGRTGDGCFYVSVSMGRGYARPFCPASPLMK